MRIERGEVIRQRDPAQIDYEQILGRRRDRDQDDRRPGINIEQHSGAVLPAILGDDRLVQPRRHLAQLPELRQHRHALRVEAVRVQVQHRRHVHIEADVVVPRQLRIVGAEREELEVERLIARSDKPGQTIETSFQRSIRVQRVKGDKPFPVAVASGTSRILYGDAS